MRSVSRQDLINFLQSLSTVLIYRLDRGLLSIVLEWEGLVTRKTFSVTRERVAAQPNLWFFEKSIQLYSNVQVIAC